MLKQRPDLEPISSSSIPKVGTFVSGGPFSPTLPFRESLAAGCLLSSPGFKLGTRGRSSLTTVPVLWGEGPSERVDSPEVP